MSHMVEVTKSYHKIPFVMRITDTKSRVQCNVPLGFTGDASKCKAINIKGKNLRGVTLKDLNGLRRMRIFMFWQSSEKPSECWWILKGCTLMNIQVAQREISNLPCVPHAPHACRKLHMPLRSTGHPTVIVPMIPRLWSMLTIMPIAHVVLTKVEAFAVTAEFMK